MYNLQKTVKKLAIIAGLMAALPTFGMENSVINHNKPTYPCDNCHEEKTELNYSSLELNTRKCEHILCQECDDIIKNFARRPRMSYSCAYCPYFYYEKNKQCWQRTNQPNSGGFNNSTAVSAKYFKKANPNRVLPDIIPSMLPQNAGNPPTLGNFTIDNKIKWFGAAGIAIIACYGVYTWWKGEDSQEKDTDDEQEDLEKEEVRPEEQV